MSVSLRVRHTWAPELDRYLFEKVAVNGLPKGDTVFERNTDTRALWDLNQSGYDRRLVTAKGSLNLIPADLRNRVKEGIQYSL